MLKKMYLLIALCSLLFSIIGCATAPPIRDPRNYLELSREEMLIETYMNPQSPLLDIYMEYFEIEIPKNGSASWHRAGTSDEYAVFVFSPPKPTHTVIFVHGYLSHTGSASFLINHLLSLNLRVVCADLPGHGLSLGERADIEDFANYGKFVKDIRTFARIKWTGNIDYIGHSTGGAAILEHLRRGNRDFDKIILLAPLVRTWMWDVSLAGLSLTEIFTDSFPALRNEASRDKDFLRKTDVDQLRLREVAIHWVRSLEQWNEELKKDVVPIDKEVLILQGTSDTVVDSKYGKEYYDRMVPNTKYVLIEDAIHCLHADKQPYRRQVFAQITNYLRAH